LVPACAEESVGECSPSSALARAEGVEVKVMVGGSFVFADESWRKCDVECSEEDLHRLGGEHGFDPSKLTLRQAFRLLELEASICWYTEMIGRYDIIWDTPSNRGKLAGFKTAKEKLLADIG